MTRLDQFESAFRSADKPVCVYERIEFARILLVSDLAADRAVALLARVRGFLSAIDGPGVEWLPLPGDRFRTVGDLLAAVSESSPDLVVSYRHLHSDAWRWPHSLGEHLDVLTQATTVPVLVLPHPAADTALPHSVSNTDRVMAITDHLVGDARLVNHALRMTAPGGTCWLTHVESQPQLDRLFLAISKIPEIDTEDARNMILEQLLKEPQDYIDSCREVIAREELDLTVAELIGTGRRTEEYKRLIEEHEVDLLVMNTLDGDQLAMHGQAYPLAVELRQIPLLML